MTDQILAEVVLTDNCLTHKGEIKVRVELHGGFLEVYAEGYGEPTAAKGCGTPVALELYEGRLRLIVSTDITAEEPTIIDLEGAREDRVDWSKDQ